jgi:hypothetical protein
MASFLIDGATLAHSWFSWRYPICQCRSGLPGRTYWPADVPRERTVAAFRQLFATFGYDECVGDGLEPGFEKVALFANALGKPTHAARQRPDGRWTSKLGESEDIEHRLRDLEGDVYGVVVPVIRRPLSPANP